MKRLFFALPSLFSVLGSFLAPAISLVVALVEPIMRIAFPASPLQLVPASAFSTPAVLGRVEARSFLSRRASREPGHRKGHWAMASPLHAV